MKRMTNEPIHPKHARLTRRGVPIFRYSQLKVRNFKIINYDTNIGR